MARGKKYYVFHKPYGVLSQFSKEHDKQALSDYLDIPKDIYPVGRLDENSEGLLLLTNDKSLTEKLLNPSNEHKRSYLVQVEGQITKAAIKALCTGVNIKLPTGMYHTLPAEVKKLGKVKLPDRTPPVRKDIQTSWIKISLIEGKNRQVRRMTAAVGFPTLRLVRSHIEDLDLGSIKSGEFVNMDKGSLYRKLNLNL